MLPGQTRVPAWALAGEQGTNAFCGARALTFSNRVAESVKPARDAGMAALPSGSRIAPRTSDKRGIQPSLVETVGVVGRAALDAVPRRRGGGTMTIKVRLGYSGKAIRCVTCTCGKATSSGPPQPDPACNCDCQLCRGCRATTCECAAAQAEGASGCSCPSTCPCVCDCCHTKGATKTAAAAQRHASSDLCRHCRAVLPVRQAKCRSEHGKFCNLDCQALFHEAHPEEEPAPLCADCGDAPYLVGGSNGARCKDCLKKHLAWKEESHLKCNNDIKKRKRVDGQ